MQNKYNFSFAMPACIFSDICQRTKISDSVLNGAVFV